LSAPARALRAMDPARGRVIKRERHTVVWSQELKGGTRAVLKMYRRRSALTARRERLLTFRAEREYRVLRHLHSAGIACPEPLFWCHGHSEQNGHWEVLATREIEGARSLASFIGRQTDSLDFARLFRSLRRMHDSGVFHGSLFVSNLLVAPRPDGGKNLLVTDAPRALLFSGSIVGTRMALYDLLDLSEVLLRVFDCMGDLDAYGLADRDRQRFLRLWPTYTPSKVRRQVLRGEFMIRAALRLTPGSGPRGPASTSR